MDASDSADFGPRPKTCCSLSSVHHENGVRAVGAPGADKLGRELLRSDGPLYAGHLEADRSINLLLKRVRWLLARQNLEDLAIFGLKHETNKPCTQTDDDVTARKPLAACGQGRC